MEQLFDEFSLSDSVIIEEESDDADQMLCLTKKSLENFGRQVS